jgi:hypothetical protein
LLLRKALRNLSDWENAVLIILLLKKMIAQEKTEKKRRMRRTSWTTALASVINLKTFIASIPKVAQEGVIVK